MYLIKRTQDGNIYYRVEKVIVNNYLLQIFVIDKTNDNKLFFKEFKMEIDEGFDGFKAIIDRYIAMNCIIDLEFLKELILEKNKNKS
jgi:hypothetical protein